VSDLSFEHLGPDEQDLVRELMRLQDITTTRSAEVEIIPVAEWLNSDYHVGAIKDHIYPFWKEEINDIFGDGIELNYNEIIITGSLSTGKSWAALVVWLRLLYIFSHFDNLPRLLGLYPGSRVFMAYLSVSISEAEFTGFGDFRNMLDATPYFRDQYKRNMNKSSVLELPNGLNILSGSDVLHFIGQNLFSVIFDEANYVRRGGGNPGDVDKALTIYKAARLRIRTRMANSKSMLAGLNILISSVTHQSSATEQIIADSKTTSETKVIATKVYEARPAGTYKPEKFMFFVGNDLYSPRVLESRDDMLTLLPETERVKIPPGEFTSPQDVMGFLPEDMRDLIELVPVDFLVDCRRYPEQALMDIIGHSVAAKHNFFRDRASWNACVELGKKLNMRHPFSQESVTVSVKGDTLLSDYLDLPYLKQLIGEQPLFMALDQSISGDATGMAGAFPLFMPDLEEYIIVLAFALRIVPPGGDDEIMIEKCRKLIPYLKGNGIRVRLATYDQYQSRSSIQLLMVQGINAELFSVDANDECWMEAANRIYQRRLAMYEYAPFRTEWFKLIHDRVRRKIDHPKDGSKDVADAATSAIFHAWMSVAEREARKGSNDRMNAVLSVLTKMAKPDESMKSITQSFFGDVKQISI